MYTASIITAILAVCAFALPTPSPSGEPTPLPSGTSVIGPLGVTINPTCNSTQTRQIISGLSDAAQLSSVARSFLLETGNTSPIFTKYFGANASSAAVIGVYDRILWANKEGVLLRCDDIDGKCAANTTWAGHHRKTAPLETVICGPSFEKRLYLQQMCSRGYTVSKSPLNLFWASDLLHRMFHVPTISEGRIEHVAGADGYDGSLELAMSGEPRAVENSDSLQYFALEVFAERVAEPGIGCL